MKLIVVFADGQGHLRIEAVRAPEIRRREIAVETGSSRLVVYSIPPRDIELQECVRRLANRLEGRVVESEADHALVQELANRELVVGPAFRRFRRNLVRCWKCTAHAILATLLPSQATEK